MEQIKTVNNDTLASREEQNKDKRDKIIILILGIATILIALIGATFAYFTAVINKVNGNQSVIIQTATIEGLTYKADNPIVLTKAMPGSHAESTFSITNPNASASVKYSMKFVPIIDEFTNEDGNNQLVLTITGGGLSSSKTIDFTDGKNAKNEEIINGATIEASGKHEYTARIDFVDNNKEQNSNMEKSFAGYIEVSEAIVVETT